MRQAIAITAATFGLGGCSGGADRAAAEAGVVQFHQMVDAQRYHDIYVGAADEFRSAAREADGVRFLQMIHDRLGAVRSTTPTGWRVNVSTGGTMVTLNYNTQFASAAGTENFVFRTAGSNARLVGYHVNSLALAQSGAPAAPEQAKSGGAPAPAQPSTVVPIEPPKPPEPPRAAAEK